MHVIGFMHHQRGGAGLQNIGLSSTQLALAFVNDRPFVTSNIIDATSIQQLKENIETTQLTLNQTILDELNSIHAEFSNPCP